MLLRLPFNRDLWEAVSGQHLHLRIGNEPPTTSIKASLDAYEAFRRRLTEIGCRYFDAWQRREAIFAETDVCFRDANGRPRGIPCAVVARVLGGRLQDLRLHLDPSPIP